MAFCTECGTQLPAGARFCPGCGASASPAQTAQAPKHPRSTNGSPSSQTPSHPTSYAQPAQTAGGSRAAWILPLLIVVAALAILYTLFTKAPDRTNGAGTEAQVAAGDAAPVNGDPTTANQASSAAGASASAGPSGTATSAATLDSAFFRDPAGASALYRGPIRVSGIIASMVQPGPTPALSMEGRSRFNYMIVNFPNGYRERLAPLGKGQFIQVTCNNVRSLGGTTILDGCELD